MAIEKITKDGKEILRMSFQPTLEDGVTAIGGVQVVEAETMEGLLEAQQQHYVNLYRRNRELMRSQEVAKSDVPEGAEKALPAIKIMPRALTQEERLRIIRGITDPEKIDEALDLALEAKFGTKPAELSRRVESTADNSEQERARSEASTWAENHPEFYPSHKNGMDMAKWIESRGLAFRQENFDKAFAALAALLEQRPTEEVKKTDSAPPANTPPAALPPEKKQSSGVPTTPTRRQTSTPAASSGAKLTAKQIIDMPHDERARRIKQDPNFLRESEEALKNVRFR